MQKPTPDAAGAPFPPENPVCDCARPVETNARMVGVRQPVQKPAGLLQFWRLSPRLELRRGHGRLRIDGSTYWK